MYQQIWQHFGPFTNIGRLFTANIWSHFAAKLQPALSFVRISLWYVTQNVLTTYEFEIVSDLEFSL